MFTYCLCLILLHLKRKLPSDVLMLRMALHSRFCNTTAWVSRAVPKNDGARCLCKRTLTFNPEGYVTSTWQFNHTRCEQLATGSVDRKRWEVWASFMAGYMICSSAGWVYMILSEPCQLFIQLHTLVCGSCHVSPHTSVFGRLNRMERCLATALGSSAREQAYKAYSHWQIPGWIQLPSSLPLSCFTCCSRNLPFLNDECVVI